MAQSTPDPNVAEFKRLVEEFANHVTEQRQAAEKLKAFAFFDDIVHAFQDIGGAVTDATHQIVNATQQVTEHAVETVHAVATAVEVTTHVAEATAEAGAIAELRMFADEASVRGAAAAAGVSVEELVRARAKIVDQAMHRVRTRIAAVEKKLRAARKKG